MKILQVTNFFKPSWEGGGPARAAYQISRKLTENGHDVTVYTTDGYKSRLNIKKNVPVDVDGIRTYYFKNFSDYFTRKIVFPIPYYAPKVIKNDISSFDIVHIHEYRTLLAILTHYYAKKHGVPYVLQARGSVLPFFQKQTIKRIFDIFFKDILLDASKLIALTEREAEEYLQMGADKKNIEIIPNGIDFSQYEYLPQKGSFRNKYSIKNDEKLILYLGRIHKIKGVDMLVNAFSNITQKLDNTKLIIAGPDDGFLNELYEKVENLNIKDKVIFTGPLYEQDKLEAYIDSDIYVLPSVSECFPNTVLEACACGLPVIVTDGCGIKDLVKDNFGYVVDISENSLSNALLELLTNEELRVKFGETGHRLVYDKFTWKEVVSDMENLYEKCVSSY